mmetsp:Transcript_12160/g.32191  ORF Transcript_12160/g.32191 Transcript_12160/m.32191 type:complete len:150 (+) Transcript_12160:90-539(+)
MALAVAYSADVTGASDHATCGGCTAEGISVEALLSRCCTHERPVALTQASSVVLDAFSAHLGESSKLGESRSDKMRRVLKLTDNLRQQFAEEVEAASAWCESRNDARQDRAPANSTDRTSGTRAKAAMAGRSAMTLLRARLPCIWALTA